jgi:hypothetical protein
MEAVSCAEGLVMRIAMAVVVGAACALTSGGRELPVAPPPRAKPTDADWLPKWGSAPREKSGVYLGYADPPSAFPELTPPPIPQTGGKEAVEQYRDSLEKAYPRLRGTIAVTIEPTDDTLRKLLKARLYQGALEFGMIEDNQWAISGPTRPGLVQYRECLSDMHAAVVELWANQPKEIVPWLEEMVIAAKMVERIARNRTAIGTSPPTDLQAARRFRLKMEAELWKAKNAK